MRKLLFFCLILVSTLTFSQSPHLLNYQGVARDATGTVINSGTIGIRFEIWRTSPSGTKVYQEEISSTPSAAGIFTAAIGNGTATIGTFSLIPWANGPYFITVSIDPTGGTSFTTIGSSQLLSVPYALYAETAGNTQTVNLSGPNVIGAYPNYTITAGSTYSAGAGISISSGSIINTSLNQTVSINQSGIANVLGVYPNYTVDVANPNLNYNSGTQVLTLTQGTAVSTATISSTSTSVSIVGAGVSGAYPSYTITPPPAASITAGNSNITVSGTGPGFTVSSVPTLSLSGAQLSISNGNTVTLPTGTTYTNGLGIGLTSGTIITNTAPDQPVIINGGTNVLVNSAYPNFTVNAVPTLSIAGNVISISGGNSITLPVPLSYTAGTGISIAGGIITNTAPNQTVGVSGPGVIGSYPNYTVTASPATTVTAGNNIVVNGASPTYTVNSPTYSLNFANSSTGVLTNGINNTSVSLPQPTLTLGGVNSNIISAGSNSITIPFYTAGNGIQISGSAPNFTMGVVTTGTSAPWSTLGNAATNPTVNFIGTTDNIPFSIRVNNQKAGKIDHLLSNAFFGYQTGNANTTGIFNSAFGNQALLSNTTGSNNAAIGTNALYFNTSGINNTAVGYQPLYSNSNGSSNTANGYQALYTTNGSNNTAIGAFAGKNTTGTGNVFIGYSAGSSSNTSDKLFIANSAAAVPLIYGDFSSGQVGIGTTSPTHVLDLFSSSTSGLLNLRTNLANTQITMDDGAANDVYLTTSNGVFDIWTASAQRLTVDLAGFVGIGQPAPTTKLNLHGVNTSTFVNAFSASPETAIRVHNNDLTQNNFSSLIFSSQVSNFTSYEAAKIVGINTNHTAGSIGGDLVFMTRDPANIFERMRIASNGNVGIRNANPAADLDINGYTKLGPNSPPVQIVKLTGTTAATQGASTTIPIPAFAPINKILSISVMVNWSGSPGEWIQSAYTASTGFNFNWYVSGPNLIVTNVSGSSGSILTKAIQVLITYEQ